MTTWSDFELAAPALASTARAAFEATLHHVVATLRADGNPRVSGTEARFYEQDLWLGCMPGSRKAHDLRRDPRFALHAAPLDLDMARGDAKVSGRAVEATDLTVVAAFLDAVEHPGDPTEALLFALDLEQVVVTSVNGDELVITSWSPASGVRETRRT